jgi:hypothetical protein
LKLPLALKRCFWLKSTRIRREFSSNLTESNSIKILGMSLAPRVERAFVRSRMVTVAVTFGLAMRASAARQPKFHHARRLKPGAGPEWVKGLGIDPALAFA